MSNVTKVGAMVKVTGKDDSFVSKVAARVNIPTSVKPTTGPSGIDPSGIDPAVRKVAGRVFQDTPPFRIQSQSGSHSVELRISEKMRASLTSLIEELAGHLAEEGEIGIIQPSLDLLTIIRPGGERDNLYLSDLSEEARLVFISLKALYHTNYGGLSSVRPTFNNDHEKSNRAGFKPFATRVTADPSARRFMKRRFGKATEQMTEEMKLQASQRVQIAEIVLAKKIKGYEKFIKKVEEDLSKKGSKKLEQDLIKLRKEYNELKGLDPHALYWLCAFYPQNPDDEKECLEQAEAIYKLAVQVTKNETYARELASVFIPGRKQYWEYCANNNIQMKKTQPMEDILKEVVEIERRGSYSFEEEELKEGYRTDIAKTGRVKIATEIQNQIINQVEVGAAKKAEIVGRTKLANQFVKTRAEDYREVAKSCEAEAKRVRERKPALERELAEKRQQAFNFIGEGGVDQSISTTDLISNLERSIQTSPSYKDEMKQVKRELRRINTELATLQKQQRGLELNADNLKQRSYALEDLGLTDDDKQKKQVILREIAGEMRKIEVEERKLEEENRVMGLDEEDNEIKSPRALQIEKNIAQLKQNIIRRQGELKKIDLGRFKRLETLYPYFNENIDKQRSALPVMKKQLKRKGYDKETINIFETLIFNSEIRRAFKEMKNFRKDEDKEKFTQSILKEFRIKSNSGTNQFGEPLALGNLTAYTEGKLKEVEYRICESAKASLKRSIAPIVLEEEEEEDEMELEQARIQQAATSAFTSVYRPSSNPFDIKRNNSENQGFGLTSTRETSLERRYQNLPVNYGDIT